MWIYSSIITSIPENNNNNWNITLLLYLFLYFKKKSHDGGHVVTCRLWWKQHSVKAHWTELKEFSNIDSIKHRSVSPRKYRWPKATLWRVECRHSDLNWWRGQTTCPQEIFMIPSDFVLPFTFRKFQLQLEANNPTQLSTMSLNESRAFLQPLTGRYQNFQWN